MQVLTMPPDHHESQGSGYGHNSWINMGGYSQGGPTPTMSPMQEYPGFDFHQPPMPIEPSYNMPRPPPYATGVAQMPAPLIMPQGGMWPSMIASQNQQSSYPPRILPANPVQTPLSAGTGSDVTPTSAKATTSRRKLTDEERRLMCLEAEQNPTMKQTQIGAKFNVERSTVSKILRQKDKYITPKTKEEVTSPGKKSKAKLPDFEKTLANWVRNQQKKGTPVTDADLRKQARVFSFSRSDQALLSSPSWLEKFKVKNGLTKAGSGSNSDNVVDSSTTSNSHSHANTPVQDSPTSSGGLVSPPISAIEQQDRGDEDFFAMGQGSNDDDLEESLSGPVLSPLSAGDDDATDLAMTDEYGTSLASNVLRQRSQTFPHLTDFSSMTSRPSTANSVGTAKPSLPRSLTTSLTSPNMTPIGHHSRASSIDPRQTMKRHKSVPDIHESTEETVRFAPMQPPPLPRSTSNTTSPLSPSQLPLLPMSPNFVTENGLIRNLHDIKKALQAHGIAEPDDYVYIGKLMEKLKLIPIPSTTGGLSQGGSISAGVGIERQSSERETSPRTSKKRTLYEASS